MDTTMDQFESEKLVVKSESSPRQYAGFWMRFWAYLVDLIVISSINGILLNPLYKLSPLERSEEFLSLSTFLSAVIIFGYFVLMTKFFSATIGKMLFGLKVVHINEESLSWSTIIFREWISRYFVYTIWILYIVVAFTPKKQGLHDIFSDTTVIHER
ncbi:RDD family protein [Bacillus carboniphilus]|uniref:RDD family protein n=1 Tax=Bacillus carboniphilus TaxID=86663 RepID=A0ABY9JXW2_9BACI|nr:RDD family protein [Bacillus carboniphilus]WLR44185.1 RDD family protein [Bacillus carboniphilus]